MSISLLLTISVVFSVAGFPSCFSTDQQYEECRLLLRCGSGLPVFPNITYPFWGNNIGKPKFCGHKDFELTCTEYQNLTIEIKNLTFRVVSTNLDNKTITVADDGLFEGGCPNIYNFTGDDRFTLNPTTETIDLFDCSLGDEDQALSEITCEESNKQMSTYHFFGSSDYTHNCRKVGEIPMLTSAKNVLIQSNGSDQALKIALEKGVELRYNIEDKVCPSCSKSGGICGSESRSESFRCLCSDRPHNRHCNDHKG